MQKTMPLVSVVIPVYNGGAYLEKAVESVIKNTYKNKEVILIDDGSTDHSKKLCHMLERKYPHVNFYSFKKNKGLGRVLNFALKKAKGTYICRINQDDEMHKSRIRKQVKFMQDNPDVVLVGSWLLVEDEQGKQRINKFLEHDEEIKRTWLKLSPCWDASVLYRRDAALSVGGYDQTFWPSDDLHMWYRLGRLGKIANLQEPLVKIKFHTQAASVKYHKKHLLTTYIVHRWAHANVEKASWGTQLFWMCELLAGMVFPPRFNWFVYRLIKKYIIYPISLYNRSSSNTINILKPSAYVISQT